MNEADQQQLTDYWHKNTCHLNEQIDDAFKLAQDQAYELGLKRGSVIAERLATDALTALAGIVCTPAEGYLKAPACLGTDIGELRKLAEGKIGECLWNRHADDSDVWGGSCGIEFVLIDDGPAENGMEFCPQCGKHLNAEKEAESV